MKLWLAKANLKKKNKKNEVDAQVTKEKKITYLWQIFFNQEVLFLNDWQRWYKAHDNVKNLFKQFVSIKKKDRIRNGGYIPTNEKEVLAIKTHSGTQTASNVFCLILIKIC